MTIQNADRSISFTADGTTTVFGFTFVSLDKDTVFASVNDVVDTGVIVFLNENQDTNPGGTATFPIAPAISTIVKVERIVQDVQLAAFDAFNPLPAPTVELTFDKLVLMIQEKFDFVEGGTIEGDTSFAAALQMNNDIPIVFKNAAGSVNPADAGVYRILNDGSDTFAIQISDQAGGWTSLHTIVVSDTVPNYPLGVSSSVPPGDADHLTRRDFVDAADLALSNAITSGDATVTAGFQAGDAELESAKVNRAGDTMTGPLDLTVDPTNDFNATNKRYVDGKDDDILNTLGSAISALQAGKINRAGDSMDDQLNVPLAPDALANAVSQSYVLSVITALVEGLTFLGFFDASPGLLPVPTPPVSGGGGFFFVSVDGTLSVSDGVNPPTPTPVERGDKIVFDAGPGHWVHIPLVTVAAALAVSFDPTGTNYGTTLNVQEALEFADSSMFMHIINNIAETVTGQKTFTDNLLIADQQQIQWSNTNTFDAAGNLRTFTDGDGKTLLEKRNSTGTAWILALSVDIFGDIVLGEALTLDRGVTIKNGESLLFNNAVNDGGDGTFSVFTDGSDLTHFRKRIGGSPVDFLTIDSLGDIFHQTFETFNEGLAVPSNKLIRWNGAISPNGDFTIFNNTNDVTEIRKVNTVGDSVVVATVSAEGLFTLFSATNFVGGVSVDNDKFLTLASTGGINSDGAFRATTLLSPPNVTVFQKRISGTFEDIFDIDTAGITSFSKKLVITDSMSLANLKPLILRGVGGLDVSDGSLTLVGGGDNVTRFQKQTPLLGLVNVMEFEEDGSIAFILAVFFRGSLVVDNGNSLLFNNAANDGGDGTLSIFNDGTDLTHFRKVIGGSPVDFLTIDSLGAIIHQTPETFNGGITVPNNQFIRLGGVAPTIGNFTIFNNTNDVTEIRKINSVGASVVLQTIDAESQPFYKEPVTFEAGLVVPNDQSIQWGGFAAPIGNFTMFNNINDVTEIRKVNTVGDSVVVATVGADGELTTPGTPKVFSFELTWAGAGSVTGGATPPGWTFSRLTSGFFFISFAGLLPAKLTPVVSIVSADTDVARVSTTLSSLSGFAILLEKADGMIIDDPTAITNVMVLF